MTENPRCPYCGATATDADKRHSNLEALGYLHRDDRFDCSACGKTWVHGVPRGTVDSDKWVCDSCGGDYIPHFLFANLREHTIETRPKCSECYHVPESYIEIESKFHGENVRGFFSHHLTTGERGEAEGDPI